MLANSLPQDVRARVREAIGKHLDAIASEEWPAMAEERMNLRSFPPQLEEAMAAILSFAPVGANQQLVQNRALIAVEDAVEFRRNRVGVSRAEIAPVQWTVSHCSLGPDSRHHRRNPHQRAIGDGGRDVCLFNGSLDVSCSPNGLRSSVRLGRLHPAADCLSRGDAGVTARTEIEPPRCGSGSPSATSPRFSARRQFAQAPAAARRRWLYPTAWPGFVDAFGDHEKQRRVESRQNPSGEMGTLP